MQIVHILMIISDAVNIFCAKEIYHYTLLFAQMRERQSAGVQYA